MGYSKIQDLTPYFVSLPYFVSAAVLPQARPVSTFRPSLAKVESAYWIVLRCALPPPHLTDRVTDNIERRAF